MNALSKDLRQNPSLDYDRSPKGERVNDEKPSAPGENVSTAAVLTEHGIEAECLYFGGLGHRSAHLMWNVATRRRFQNQAATSRRTPQTHPSG